MRSVFLVIALTLSPLAAEAQISFKGYMISPGRTLFVLASERGGTSEWASVGQTIDGFVIVSFDSRSERLTVERDGRRVELPLLQASPAGADRNRAEPRPHDSKALLLARELARAGDRQLAALLDAYETARITPRGGRETEATRDEMKRLFARI